jgi:hypothetical protein
MAVASTGAGGAAKPADFSWRSFGCFSPRVLHWPTVDLNGIAVVDRIQSATLREALDV